LICGLGARRYQLPTDELKAAINRNIPAIVTDNFKAETWYMRRNGLQALGKFIETSESKIAARSSMLIPAQTMIYMSPQ
jgi:hypothetical protein